MIMEVIISDLHLKSHSLRKEIVGDSFYSLQQCIDFCKANNINALHIAGDLFDNNLPTSDCIDFFKEAINQLPAKTKVYAIEGQHDRANPPWFKAATSADRIIHASKINDYTVCGYPAIAFDQAPKEIIREQIINTPTDKRVMVLHQWFKSTLQINWNVDEDDIPEFIKLVVAGDLHKPLTWKNKNSTVFAYCGSTCLQKLDETESKSFILLDNNLNITRVPLKTRPIWRSVIANEKQLDSWIKESKTRKKEFELLTKNFPENIRRPVIYIKFSDVIPSALDKIKEAVGDWSYLYTTVLITNYVETEYETTNETLISCLDMIVDKNKDATLHQFIIDLLSNNNTSEVIKILKTRLISKV